MVGATSWWASVWREQPAGVQEAMHVESIEQSSRDTLTTFQKRLDCATDELKDLRTSKLDASQAVTREMVSSQMVQVCSYQ